MWPRRLSGRSDLLDHVDLAHPGRGAVRCEVVGQLVAALVGDVALEIGCPDLLDCGANEERGGGEGGRARPE
jgi:hypothetical protein